MSVVVVIGALLWSTAVAASVLGAILRWSDHWLPAIIATGALGSALLGIGWAL